MDLKINEIVQEMEDDFFSYAKESYDLLADLIKEKLNLDVYEATKLDCSIDAVRNCLWLFLDKMKNPFYEILECAEFTIEEIEIHYIHSFILSVVRNRKNIEFLKKLLLRENIISSFTEENGDFIIESKYGIIVFRKALDEFMDEDLNSFLKTIEVESGCHQISEYLIKKYDNYKAVTSIAVQYICKEFFHSFILDGNTVIDIANNLIMDKETYYTLFMVEELNIVNNKEMQEQSELSKKYDESKTLFPLLRNAIYINNTEKVYLQK